MNPTKADRAFLAIFLIVIFVFFLMILVCFFTQQFLIDGLHMKNAFTEFVLGEERSAALDAGYPKTSDEIRADTHIAWAEAYPFSEQGERGSGGGNASGSSPLSKITAPYQRAVDYLKLCAGKYSTDYLIGYHSCVGAARSMERALQWNFASYQDYNNVYFVDDDYLSNIIPDSDPTDVAESLTDLRDFCESNGSHLLFVLEPSKICRYEDTDVDGSVDYSNKRGDDLLARLSDADVDTMDLRELLHKEGREHHGMFYNTDHHWKAESGLWAAGRILAKLADEFGCDADAASLDPGRFTYEVYANRFLGSLGKKVTLSRSDPDDIALIYPDFDTEIRYVCPDIGMDETGDFSVTYDMAYLERRGYYNANAYAAYNHGDGAMRRIENLLTESDCRILVIHNSFANCVIPFLSLGVKQVDALDLRQFTGSVEAYIRETEPDVVIVMYPPDNVHKIDWNSHTDTFDFR